jgi:hypothetical protein
LVTLAWRAETGLLFRKSSKMAVGSEYMVYEEKARHTITVELMVSDTFITVNIVMKFF